MAWVKQTKATDERKGFLASALGFLVEPFLTGGSFWTKQTKASDSWTKQTKAS